MTPKEYILNNRFDELMDILDELELPFHEDLLFCKQYSGLNDYIEYEIRYKPPSNATKKFYNFLIYRLGKYEGGDYTIYYKSVPFEDSKIQGAEKFFNKLRMAANIFIEQKTKLERLIDKL